VTTELQQTLARFAPRHRDFRATLESNFAAVASSVEDAGELSVEQRLLIGAYFTHEYSIEAAALSNPSAFLAPDQSGLGPDETRIVLSLRAIGEGHISSIEFRTAVVLPDGQIRFDAPGPYPTVARHRPATYVKEIFRQKLIELHVHNDMAESVLEQLNDHFSMRELNTEIEKVNRRPNLESEASRATRALHWLAASNYESSFSEESQLSERVLFPAGPTESSGMEDARFVRFVHDEGTVTYFATYTAYDGYEILPQLIETRDLVNFRIATLNGTCAKNKGIALFPRKVGGRYAALARLDNENNFLMTSDNVRFWHESQVIQTPRRPWEMTHIGNCGSPIETDEGWLVITHGVGPMRQYALGAILLDLENPSQVIGSLQEPLLEPNENERDGYVPNVVYSCGSLIVGTRLIVPYGFSDSGTGVASLKANDLLAELKSARCAFH
jgi:predicted GH43/DUF377 family glycosyl hydrolase